MLYNSGKTKLFYIIFWTNTLIASSNKTRLYVNSSKIDISKNKIDTS